MQTVHRLIDLEIALAKQVEDGERKVAAEHQEAHVHALLVLEDEDKDHHQGHQADDDRGPGAAQASLPLAWKWLAIFLHGCRSRFIHRRWYIK